MIFIILEPHFPYLFNPINNVQLTGLCKNRRVCVFKNQLYSETPLVVQLLGIHPAMPGMWVHSLVGKLSSHKPRRN